jgi:hypothetical protein
MSNGGHFSIDAGSPRAASPPHVIEVPVGDEYPVELPYRLSLQLHLHVGAGVYEDCLLAQQGR